MDKLNIWTGKEKADAKSDEAVEKWLNTVPPWRDRSEDEDISSRSGPVPDLQDESRGRTWRGKGDDLTELVNMALWLRRPMLITGDPGVGKSSLAYSLAYELGLGRVLRWEVSSRTTLLDGLYRYDAVEHLGHQQRTDEDHEVEEFITLGPLGTALVGSATDRPRVLLIDEIDKSDYDLPNDLLHVLEEGMFTIPELMRFGGTGKGKTQSVQGFGEDGGVELQRGRVVSGVQPVVVMTSNNEREFPDAFLRRCVEIELAWPDPETMKELVLLHFARKPELLKQVKVAIDEDDWTDGRPDQVLQALFLKTQQFDEDILKRTFKIGERSS